MLLPGYFLWNVATSLMMLFAAQILSGCVRQAGASSGRSNKTTMATLSIDNLAYNASPAVYHQSRYRYVDGHFNGAKTSAPGPWLDEKWEFRAMMIGETLGFSVVFQEERRSMDDESWETTGQCLMVSLRVTLDTYTEDRLDFVEQACFVSVDGSARKAFEKMKRAWYKGASSCEGRCCFESVEDSDHDDTWERTAKLKIQRVPLNETSKADRARIQKQKQELKIRFEKQKKDLEAERFELEARKMQHQVQVETQKKEKQRREQEKKRIEQELERQRKYLEMEKELRERQEEQERQKPREEKERRDTRTIEAKKKLEEQAREREEHEKRKAALEAMRKELVAQEKVRKEQEELERKIKELEAERKELERQEKLRHGELERRNKERERQEAPRKEQEEFEKRKAAIEAKKKELEEQAEVRKEQEKRERKNRELEAERKEIERQAKLQQEEFERQEKLRQEELERQRREQEELERQGKLRQEKLERQNKERERQEKQRKENEELERKELERQEKQRKTELELQEKEREMQEKMRQLERKTEELKRQEEQQRKLEREKELENEAWQRRFNYSHNDKWKNLTAHGYWKDTNFNIAVIGSSNVGKSSFLNTLIGKDVFKTGVGRVTVFEMLFEGSGHYPMIAQIPELVVWDLPGKEAKMDLDDYARTGGLRFFDAVVVAAKDALQEFDVEVIAHMTRSKPHPDILFVKTHMNVFLYGKWEEKDTYPECNTYCPSTEQAKGEAREEFIENFDDYMLNSRRSGDAGRKALALDRELSAAQQIPMSAFTFSGFADKFRKAAKNPSGNCSISKSCMDNVIDFFQQQHRHFCEFLLRLSHNKILKLKSQHVGIKQLCYELIVQEPPVVAGASAPSTELVVTCVVVGIALICAALKQSRTRQEAAEVPAEYAAAAPQCTTTGCTRAPWNGVSGHACCRGCSSGGPHGAVCERRFSRRNGFSYDFFLCHTKQSKVWNCEDFQTSLHLLLTDNGYKVFFDKESLIGHNITVCVQKAGETGALVVTIDDHSPTPWMLQEIQSAIRWGVPIQTVYCEDGPRDSHFTWTAVGKPAWMAKGVHQNVINKVFARPAIKFIKDAAFVRNSRSRLLDAVKKALEADDA